MTYKCPLCGSMNLSVNVIAGAKLVQNADGTASTTVLAPTALGKDGDHCWDNCATMWCDDCKHCDGAIAFTDHGEN